MKQPEGLISLLLDRKAELADRDDAAIDLTRFDEPEVLSALLTVIADEADDPDLRDTCQDSVYEIEARAGNANPTKEK